MTEVPETAIKVELPEITEKEYGYEYKFKTADSLYYTLLNFRDIIAKKTLPYKQISHRNTPWIFRGHWDANWELLPSAFRYRWYRKFHAKSTRYFFAGDKVSRVDMPKFDDYHDDLKYQIETEYSLIKEFMETANDLGIECNYAPFSYDEYKKNLDEWSHNHILPIMALARHHGIPTRLLDFSYNPLFAAFFAAFGSFEEKLGEEIDEEARETDLCIWAVNQDNITAKHWEKISAPSNRSSNLFAQEGLLIIDTKANERFIETDGYWQDLISTEANGYFIKLSLPQKKSKELLRLLWSNNITPARIMPNLDKVTETLEYKHWLLGGRIIFKDS